MSFETSSWVGRRLASDRYELTSSLGEGGMGFVFRARDSRLETDVVIKFPRVGLSADSEFTERFSREVRSLVQLSHPHVVRVIDVGQHEGLPFVVLQYLSGGSLEQRRPRDAMQRPCPVPAASLRTWLPAVAEALDFIHAQQYVHRDIKPENILFDQHGHPYVSDFGVAKALAASTPASNASLTGAGMVLGTPRYIAPEVVLGQSLDGRADQYSLAITVHELLAGQPPIDAASPTAVLVAQTNQPPPALRDVIPSLSEALSATVLRALSKDPTQRFSNCTQFAQAVLKSLPQQTNPPALSYGREAQARRGKVACPACAAKMTLSEKSRGKQTRCPMCHVPIEVARDLSGLRELLLADSSTALRDTPSHGSVSPTRRVAGGSGPQPAAEKVDDWGGTKVVSAAEVEAALGKTEPPVAARGRWRRLASVGALCALVAIAALGLWQAAPWSRAWLKSDTSAEQEPVIAEPAAEPTVPAIAAIGDPTIELAEQLVLAAQVTNTPPAGNQWKFRLTGEAPAGMRIHPETGVIVWDPAEDRQPGKYPVTLQVSTEKAGSAVARMSFVVTVARPQTNTPATRSRAPPTVAIVKTEPAEPIAGRTLTIHLAGEAADAGKLRYEYKFGSDDEWKKSASPTIQLDDLRPGTLTVRVRAVDSYDTASSVVISTLQVKPPIDPAALVHNGKSLQEWIHELREHYRGYYAQGSDAAALAQCTAAVKAIVELGSTHPEVVQVVLKMAAQVRAAANQQLWLDGLRDFDQAGNAVSICADNSYVRTSEQATYSDWSSFDGGLLTIFTLERGGNNQGEEEARWVTKSGPVRLIWHTTSLTALADDKQLLSSVARVDGGKMSYRAGELLLDDWQLPAPIAELQGAHLLALIGLMGRTALVEVNKQLGNPELSDVALAVLAAQDNGVTRLEPFLDDVDFRVRYRAIWALNGGLASVNYLVASDGDVQRVSAPVDASQPAPTNNTYDVLGKRALADAERTCLIRALSDRDGLVRLAAAQTLAAAFDRDGGTAATPILVEQLPRDPWRALQLLGQLAPESQAAIPAIKEALQNDEKIGSDLASNVEFDAVFWLARIGKIELAGELLHATAGVPEDAKMVVARLIALFGEDEDSHPQLIDELLWSMQQFDDDFDILTLCVESFGSLGTKGRQDVVAAMGKVLRKPDVLRDPRDRSQVAQRHKTVELKRITLDALEAMGPSASAAAPTLLKLLPRSEYRQKALEAMAAMGPAARDTLPALEKYRQDNESNRALLFYIDHAIESIRRSE